SGWLMVRQDPRAWQGFLKSKADAALAKRTGIAIALLAFLAVFREGAETVLFIHALAKTSGGFGADLLAGLAAAALALVVLFFVINAVARRLPLRPLFIATSA
ncbi:MAG: FTR1 family protein, partial [Xanthobacteraceae bacterium]